MTVYDTSGLGRPPLPPIDVDTFTALVAATLDDFLMPERWDGVRVERDGTVITVSVGRTWYRLRVEQP